MAAARVAVLLVPRAGPAVQLGRLAGELVEEPGLQHVGEEVVVAVPPSLVVERHQEEVVAVERLQHRPAVGPARDGVGQRSGQPGQHGGPEEEVADLLGLPVHDLLDEVVDDVAVVPGEPVDEPGGVLPPLQGQGRELQGGDPSLGPPLEGADLAGGELEPHPVEVRRGLLLGEPQVGGTHLGQLAAGAQPRQRQRRVRPRRDDEAELGRQVVDQEGHRLVDRRRVDDVVVVEDEHDVLVGGGEVVEEAGQHGGDRGAAGRLQERPARTHPRPAPPYGGLRARRPSTTTGRCRRSPGTATPPRLVRPREPPSSDWASSVDFPKPAGAETSSTDGPCARAGRSAAVGRPAPGSPAAA